ncbi:MAG: hypothetical protein V4507_09755, partial [Verrucomicrobiota bacterium]
MISPFKIYSSSFFFSLFLLLIFFLSPLVAQTEPKITSALSASQFFVGDGALWTLSITGAKRVNPPEISELPGFFIHPLEPQILEQKDSKIFIFNYRIIPRQSGLLTLPEITVQADSKDLKTESEILNVGAPKTTSALRLEVSFDRPEVYVGQPVVLTFQWFSSLPLNSIKALDIQLPMIYDPNFNVIVPAEERTLGGKPETVGLPLEGQRAIAQLSSLKINEEEFKVLTLKRIFIPLKSGDFSLPATQLLCSYLPPTTNGKKQTFSYPSFFNND